MRQDDWDAPGILGCLEVLSSIEVLGIIDILDGLEGS